MVSHVCLESYFLITRSVSANDMFVQLYARKERKGNTLQGREREESLSLIPDQVTNIQTE